MSQNNARTHGKLQKCQTRQSNMQITMELCRPTRMTSKNLQQHDLMALLYLKFLLITQHEVPFINMIEATKMSSDPTENGKCTNVTNRRSRVGQSTGVDAILHLRSITLTRNSLRLQTGQNHQSKSCQRWQIEKIKIPPQSLSFSNNTHFITHLEVMIN